MWTQGAEHQVLELGDQCLVIVCEANGEDNLPRAFEQLLEFRLDGIDESGRDRLEEGTCEPVFELRGAIVEVTEVETEQINAIVGVDSVVPVGVECPAGCAAVDVIEPQRQAGTLLYGRELLVEIIQIRL